MGKETPKRPDGIPDDVWADAGTLAREWMVEQARRLGLNSGNSSMPPSSDGPADVPKKTQRTPSGRKRGGQPGVMSVLETCRRLGRHALGWITEAVTHTQRNRPAPRLLPGT